MSAVPVQRRSSVAVSTPCIRLCVLDEGAGLCLGCGRTSAEIAGWMAMGEDVRRRIMAELDARLARLPDATSHAARPGEGAR
jgi:predicted Fe-S protein YdhL (DUF1289 family)